MPANSNLSVMLIKMLEAVGLIPGMQLPVLTTRRNTSTRAAAHAAWFIRFQVLHHLLGLVISDIVRQEVKRVSRPAIEYNNTEFGANYQNHMNKSCKVIMAPHEGDTHLALTSSLSPRRSTGTTVVSRYCRIDRPAGYGD